MNSANVGIVGLGSFGALHLDVLANMTGVNVVGLASRSSERARELASQYKVPHVFTDTAEMVGAVQLDAVFIATEDTRHLEPTLTALRAGVDVFLEKPISPDLEEARQMIDEAARLKRKFMVGHVCRFEPRSATIKQRIVNGDLGNVLTVYGRRNMCKAFLDQYSFSNRIFTTGVHDIDLILWYYEGIRPVEVYMKTMRAHGKGDDVFWAIITMENGSLGIVETNWCLPEATPWRGHILLDVVGTKGAALSEIPGNGLAFWTDTAVEIPDTSYWPSIHGATVGALRDEFNYFIRCLVEDRPVTIPYPEDAYQSIRIAHALIQSAQSGMPVQI
ncbi:MAG: gfo/Idh/MocA family oxidoreductase [Chloroflexota bacterium]|nr:MAG: gfo/Idh/MocA family oxidoreductase [Chloroflexota bacterium]